MHLPHKVIITGTGRAGTTFLVRLLTELGLDTGFKPGDVQRHIDEKCQAGLEKKLPDCRRTSFLERWRGPRLSPYIIKNPAMCDTLGAILAEGQWTIDHVYIPMRDLESAALSRARIGGANGSEPGGLWKTHDPLRQKDVLAGMFFNLMYTLAVHDVPHTFLLFPRLVEDWGYAFHKLWFLVKSIAPRDFQLAFERVANRQLVHEFKTVGPAGQAKTQAASIGSEALGMPVSAVQRSQRVA